MNKCSNCRNSHGCFGLNYNYSESCDKKNTRIICGFPGIGKSFIFNNKQLDCIDSDSSKFDKADFPRNYIQHIKENLGFVDYIFVSTHREVVDALSCIPTNFTIVYPDINLKEEYLTRYSERGSSEFFINLIDKKWDEFIGDIENARCYYEINKVRLAAGEYLIDYLSKE